MNYNGEEGNDPFLHPTEESKVTPRCEEVARGHVMCDGDCEYCSESAPAPSDDEVEAKWDEELKQPIEGLLYDLNLLPEQLETSAERVAIIAITQMHKRLEALRSQLIWKDEALRKALVYLPEHLRHLRAKNDPKALSLTNDLAAIRAAIREPDGRKGE